MPATIIKTKFNYFVFVNYAVMWEKIKKAWALQKSKDRK